MMKVFGNVDAPFHLRDRPGAVQARPAAALILGGLLLLIRP